MKTALACCLVVVAGAGCVTSGPGSSAPGSAGSLTGAAASGVVSAPDPFPAPLQAPANFGPQLIIPVTGGPPVMALPLGGTLYQPLTGDPPVTGMPLFP
jgi:hypothetical protein